MTAAGRSYAANLLGTAWLAVMQVVFAPFFIRRVGIEGYGLIGFSVTLQAVLQVLDFGFAPTISRWMARFTARQDDAQSARDFARTLEAGSWSIAVLGGAILTALAHPAARLWFRRPGIPVATLAWSLALMALTVAAQWPVTFYQSGLLGLGRAAEMNAAKAAAATASAAGAATALLVRPSVTAYFGVVAAVAAIHALVLRFLFWHSLGGPARIRPAVLRTAWRFAAGMTGVTLCAVLVTQIDRIIVSRLVPLDQFGYYALAWVVAGGLAVAIMPAHNTLFPQFSALFGDARLREAFHRGARMLSVLLVPLACVVAFFAAPILAAWTGNGAIAAHSAPIAVVLVVGSTLNGLMHPPYALQLASGSTRLPLILTVGQLAFIVPAVALLTMRFGLLGAACAWPAMNALYFLIGSVWTFRLLLPGAWRDWIVRDVALPLAAALVPVVLAWRFITLPAGRVAVVLFVGLVFACSWGAARLAVARAGPKL